MKILIKVLFTCHGNICRSVGAQYILQWLVQQRGLAESFHIDSAAATRDEIGNPIYPPMEAALKARGIPIGSHRARLLTRADYDAWDWIIGMDGENKRDMQRILGEDPERKIHLLPEFGGDDKAEIADPWYTRQFSACVEELFTGCENFLHYLAVPREERLQQQLRFILELDKEKNILRQTHLSQHGRRENDAEHAWHMAVMAYVLQEYSNETVDIGKVILMCLLHDVVEIDAGDTYAYDEAGKKTQQAREAAAAKRIYGLLPADQKHLLQAVFQEFEAEETPEARFAHAMDNLQPLLLNHSNQGADWKSHDVRAEQIYARQEKTQKGSRLLYALTDALLRENIAKGTIKRRK